MKILFVCGGGSVFGKEIITISLMQGLRERGHDVRCLTSTWGIRDFTKRLDACSIPYLRLPLGFFSKTPSWLAMRMTIETLSKTPQLWLGYRRYLRDFKPDVIVHTTLHHVFHVWPFLNPKNTFFHVHDSFAPTLFYRHIFMFLNLRLRSFIGVSRYIESSIVELGIPRNKVCSVLNGIKLAETTKGNGNHGQASVSPADYSGDAFGPVKIGIIGQIGEWKGHDDFIEALRMLKTLGLSFRGVIFGLGDERYIASLKEKIKRYQLGERVGWAGFVENAREIFSSIDICVVPSRSQDPCPIVAIETAHFGVPIVATRRGGMPEIVKDGETGYLVDAGSPEQIAEKLKLLMQNLDRRQKMGQAARQYGSQHLTQDRMVQQMETTFMRAL